MKERLAQKQQRLTLASEALNPADWRGIAEPEHCYPRRFGAPRQPAIY